MHRYSAIIEWERGEQTFTDNRYSRRHVLRFDGGAVIPGSSSPLVVRKPMSDPAGVDPEELFVAAISNCHMLWFLDLARRAGFRVDRYVDNAEGFMENDAAGRMAITRVVLHPEVAFSGEKLPTRAALEEVHHHAHEECYIANSVKTDVTIELVWRES